MTQEEQLNEVMKMIHLHHQVHSDKRRFLQVLLPPEEPLLIHSQDGSRTSADGLHRAARRF